MAHYPKFYELDAQVRDLLRCCKREIEIVARNTCGADSSASPTSKKNEVAIPFGIGMARLLGWLGWQPTHP
jgi:hypothetical protein